MKKQFYIFQLLLICCLMVSCEKDPSYDRGCYLFDNQVLEPANNINGIHFIWTEENIPDNIKDVVGEILSSLVLVEGGTFVMGDNSSAESQEHTVTVSDFYISSIEVTQKQWRVIMGDNESWNYNYGIDDHYPANFISFDQAVLFIDKLNHYTGLSLRMPTEAEWEYAALGGKYSQGYDYSGSSNADEVAWCRDNSSGKMHPVASLAANELGLYDMSGNVCEWCSDWYGSYSNEPSTNPAGPSMGEKRVVRGGSFTLGNEHARCKARNSLKPHNQSLAVGLRLTMDVQR